MTGGPGLGGVAVPLGDPDADPAQKPKRQAAPKRLEEAPAKTAGGDGCSEETSKPQVASLDQPQYTDAARDAGVQGKVRLEVTVGEDGLPAEVKVLQPLHPELDDSAVQALRQARFQPARRCGKAIAARFTIAIRFTL